jgi:WD40 repeat protein
MMKKLISGVKWYSCLDIHPGGDNLIAGSYDRKLNWYDLDLGDKPYSTLRFHKKAIRSVAFHPTYPLFASCSDDGTPPLSLRHRQRPPRDGVQRSDDECLDCSREDSEGPQDRR